MVRRSIALAVLGLAWAGVAGAQIFEFHSGFWVNLHQFLCRQASEAGGTAAEAAEWKAAVEYYRREIANRDLVSAEMAVMDHRLAAAGSSEELPREGLDTGLAAVLAKAAPIYRREWWPEHERLNLAWIAAVDPLLAKHGEAMRKAVAAAWQVEWPAGTIRVDVSAYAGPHGAYTTPEPAHITISSTDAGYRGPAALEMLFHESSHLIDEKVREALTAERKARGVFFRRRGFEHAILFYTAGEIARRRLGDYEPYGIRNGMYRDGWPGSLEVLEKDWKPYLEGRIDLAAAVRAMVADYSVPQ